MPRQLPTLAEYEKASPYGRAAEYEKGNPDSRAARTRSHHAWKEGASAPLDTKVPKFATQGELEAFTEGVAWRMAWEQEHNPTDMPVPAPGEVLEVLTLSPQAAKLYHLKDHGAHTPATLPPDYEAPFTTADAMSFGRGYNVTPDVQITGVDKPTVIPVEPRVGSAVKPLGTWLDGRVVSLLTHGGKRRVVIGDIDPVCEVLEAGVVLAPGDKVLHIANGFVFKEESRAAFDQHTGQQKPDGLRPNHKELMSTKTLGHELGFSCCFRQHRAHSHCHYLHGYALGFKFVFAALDLSNEGWVVDFGGLKSLKGLLEGTFDHKTLVAEDDPQKDEILALAGLGVLSAVVVPATGCEAFARMVYEVAEQWLLDAGFSPRVRLVSVEVSEHGANSAICQG